jgi:hypothetical protein
VRRCGVRRISFGLSRRERSGAALGGVRCQRGCALKESRRSGDAASALGSVGRGFQLRGHRIIGSRGSIRSMPCPTVGVRLRIGCVGQRPMDGPAFGEIGRAVSG